MSGQDNNSRLSRQEFSSNSSKQLRERVDYDADDVKAVIKRVKISPIVTAATATITTNDHVDNIAVSSSQKEESVILGKYSKIPPMKAKQEITTTSEFASLDVFSDNYDSKEDCCGKLTKVVDLSGSCASDKDMVLVENVFSQIESMKLIEAAEELGFGQTDYPKEYRGNLRLTVHDDSLAALVWSRIREFVPPKVFEEGEVPFHVVGLNSCWRLAKYYPGDQFQCHTDTFYEDEAANQKSMFTVNIYMNQEFTGGSTVFHFSELKSGGKGGLGPRKNQLYKVVPRTGLCLLFRQPPSEHYIHEGGKLLSGVKYLFRSDVMYARASTAATHN